MNGQPIEDWLPQESNYSSDCMAYRLRLSYEDAGSGERWVDRFASFLNAVETDKVTGLVVGAWNDLLTFRNPEEVDAIVEALVAARARLTHLNAIFFGDIISAECEIASIQSGDLSPLLTAYPELTYFGVRGTNGLSLGSLCHEKLQTLVVESGGLNRQWLREVTNAHLPALEHLELWLGDDEHTVTVEADDLGPLFVGNLFPRLKYLGLRGSHIADEIALAIAHTPIVERLAVLDISRGQLGDWGAVALLESPAVAQLKKLDLYYHYCSKDMMDQLERLGIEVDLRMPMLDQMKRTNDTHKRELNGQPIKEWRGRYARARSTYRLRLPYEAYPSEWVDRFASFLNAVETDKVTGLVVGAWSNNFDSSEEVDAIVEALVAARARLTHLNAIFFGDIISAECEIASIQSGDLSPLLTAYPELTYFGVRGTNGLSLGSLCHEKLQTLVVESGGLNRQWLREVTNAHLPALEHLELWLGDDEHTVTVEADDLGPLFVGNLFPRLKYLGLRGSHIADDIALAIAHAPIVKGLKVLDLSLGTLGDRGAVALLESPAVAQLKKLDLHYHYCSEEMMERFQALGIEVDTSFRRYEENNDRYVAIGE